MNEQKNFQQSYEQGRNQAMIMAGFVYTGVVIAATVLFITFIMQAFPDSAYFTRFIMGVAGLLVGGSMLAFPFALHNWAVSGKHRAVATFLYYGEMFIIGLNTIVSFTALLFKYAGYPLPPWVAWYEPFSIGSIVYTLFAWGTVYLLDPHVKAKATEKEALDNFAVQTANMMKQYLTSDDGKRAIQQAANKKIAESFSTHPDGPNPWIKLDEQPRRLPGSILPAPPIRMTRRTYTTADLCALWEMEQDGVAAVLAQYPTVSDAWSYCSTNGFLPSDMEARNFFDIYYEVLPNRTPSYHPVELSPVKRPTAGGNGSKGF